MGRVFFVGMKICGDVIVIILGVLKFVGDVKVDG